MIVIIKSEHWKKTIIFLLALFVLSACAQSPQRPDPIEGYDRIVHPGNLLLYYAKKPAKKAEPFSVIANGIEFHVYGKAVRPSIQSMYLLEHTVINEGDTVLDVGTGSGVQAVFAAQKASHVVATDIGKDAAKSAAANVKRLGLDKKIEVRLGDLFDTVLQGEKFDVIINNINYPEDENKKDDPLWDVHERFFRDVRKYLKKDGRIYYQSGFLFNIPRIRQMLDKNNLQITSMRMEATELYSKELIVYTIERRSF